MLITVYLPSVGDNTLTSASSLNLSLTMLTAWHRYLPASDTDTFVTWSTDSGSMVILSCMDISTTNKYATNYLSMALWWSGQIWTIVQLESMSLTNNGSMLILSCLEIIATNKYATNYPSMALWWSSQVWTIVQLTSMSLTYNIIMVILSGMDNSTTSMSLTYNGNMVILPGMDNSTTNKYVTIFQWHYGDLVKYGQ